MWENTVGFLASYAQSTNIDKWQSQNFLPNHNLLRDTTTIFQNSTSQVQVHIKLCNSSEVENPWVSQPRLNIYVQLAHALATWDKTAHIGKRQQYCMVNIWVSGYPHQKQNQYHLLWLGLQQPLAYTPVESRGNTYLLFSWCGSVTKKEDGSYLM